MFYITNFIYLIWFRSKNDLRYIQCLHLVESSVYIVQRNMLGNMSDTQMI